MALSEIGRSAALPLSDGSRPYRQSSTDKLLSVLARKADRRGVATVSLREMSDETGMSRSIVRRAVKALADRRLIGVMPRFDGTGAQLANDILVLPRPRGTDREG